MNDVAVKLTVMNLERFATHDGPGIRTTVFLKGCPLHCPWCANPETQPRGLVHFYDARRCVGCGSCVSACPRGAIRLVVDKGTRHPRFDASACDGCRSCERACLQEAVELQGRVMSVGEVLDIAKRDRDYYEVSGGGVTLSGGEPLLGREQALAFFREAKALGLDTAVETTGNVPLETIEAVEPYVDHFLYDVKSLDADQLRTVVGGNARLNQENLRWLAERCADKINVRIATIPTFNYDHDTLVAMIDWTHSLGVNRVNLLPYHTLALGKYEKLGLDYDYPRQSVRDEELQPLHEYALTLGMESRIGA